jgi:hypothetical protein
MRRSVDRFVIPGMGADKGESRPTRTTPLTSFAEASCVASATTETDA